MRMATTKSALIAAVMAATLLGNGAVLADGNRYHPDRQGYSHPRDAGHRNHDKKPYLKKSRYGGRHDHGNHHRGRHDWHVTNYYKYDDDSNAEKLLIGLAIGGLIGYAISNAEYY
ncbi:MAG TPA: hypothetical protein VET88_14890 [Gammaproteobacteria bacterium]|nr:hypothetical protein [Gammaproteobacteria bacterium]